MALSLFTEDAAAPTLDRAAQRQLLAIARAAIAEGPHALDAIELATLPSALLSERAVFVTLTRDGDLRGCIGSLCAAAPLVHAVADAAHGAARHDPRFPPLETVELASTRIEISVLSELAQIAVESRRALLAELRPGIDGVLIAAPRSCPRSGANCPIPRSSCRSCASRQGCRRLTGRRRCECIATARRTSQTAITNAASESSEDKSTLGELL